MLFQEYVGIVSIVLLTAVHQLSYVSMFVMTGDRCFSAARPWPQLSYVPSYVWQHHCRLCWIQWWYEVQCTEFYVTCFTNKFYECQFASLHKCSMSLFNIHALISLSEKTTFVANILVCQFFEAHITRWVCLPMWTGAYLFSVDLDKTSEIVPSTTSTFSALWFLSRCMLVLYVHVFNK